MVPSQRSPCYCLGAMKSIDIKSLLIGVLFTSTVIFGVASTSNRNAPANGQTGWDEDQVWEWKIQNPQNSSRPERADQRGGIVIPIEKGWEPVGCRFVEFGKRGGSELNKLYVRRRVQ